MENADNVTLKEATDSDEKGLTRLYRKLYEGDEDQDFFKSKAIPSYFKSGSKVFIARSGNDTIGFVWAIYYEHIKSKGIGIIEELYVDDGYRGRGIGKELVSKAIDYLKKKKVLVVIVTTDPQMEDAQKFYKAVGFKVSREWFYYPLP
ncbi:GNAT family N-acetyltransferase [Candidatus Mancarchaeum acidiphilum]|uniref:GNAT family N-acetyltransferase n=1 Tax=Candidatus Mancarchaeum acidiphilum TaxID=1920749 RepID=A0A218NMQ9_9ARCH|nr:GNAT family N-acetyltransferase [Candidatus Mancarchaeum acidiphilum]ASI13743.1 GNAT family N-acetyltransferase [Candidatus Mancarchaeum acidiphilum]